MAAKKPVKKQGGGSNITRWVVLAVSLMVVFGAGLVAFTFILKNFETLTAEPAAVEEIPGYVAMDGVAVPVSLDNALDHYVNLDLRFQVRDKARAKEVTELIPRIRDALVRDAHRNALLRTDGVASVDLARIKERAKAVANQILGADLIANVYVIRVAKLVG